MKLQPIIAIVFFTCISLPLVLHVFGINWILEEEKRALTAFPEFTSDDKQTFTSRMDDYLDDNLPVRPFLVKTYNTATFLLGQVSSPLVLQGQEDWLYIKRKFLIDQIEGKEIMTLPKLRKYRVMMKKTDNYFAKKDANVYYTIAPNKHSIYSEYLPNDLQNRIVDEQNIDRFYDHFKNRKKYIDLRPTLFENKEEGVLLYEKYGTHWSNTGAYLAYREILSQLKRDWPSLKILREKHMDQILAPPADIGMVRALGIYHNLIYNIKDEPFYEIKKGFQPEIIQDTILVQIHDKLPEWNTRYIKTNGKGPKLLLIRDSFFNNIIDFMKYSFSEILIVHHKGGNWNCEHVRQYNPDIVIWEIVERNLIHDYPLNLK
jgi:hypothetical protein